MAPSPDPVRRRNLRIGIRLQLWLLCAATALSGGLAIALAVRGLLAEQHRAHGLAGLAGQLAPEATGVPWGLMLAIFLFAAVMVFTALAVEPTARAVRQQRHRLQRQAADLERLALVARQTSNSVLITDEKSRIQWINDGFTRLWGWTAPEACGREPGDLLAGEHTDPSTLSALRLAREAGIGHRTEILYRGKDGVDRWVDVDMQPLHHADGSVRGSIAVATEITDLVRERQHQAAILAAVPTGVLVFDRHAQVSDCNAMAETVLGRTRDEILGLSLRDLHGTVLGNDLRPLPPTDLPTRRALDTGLAQRAIPVGLVTPQGEVRWLLANAEPLVDASGRVERVIASFVDVSTLRKQERVMAATVEGAGLGLWEWDLRTGHTTCDSRFARMLGYPDAEFARDRKEMLQLLHPQDRTRWMRVVAAHLKDPAQPCRMELRLRRPDGAWAWATVSGAVVERGGSGQAVRMAGMLMDMTEHMQMQAMLLHASRTDHLTQLPNRALLMERLDQALQHWKRDPGHRFALLYMDFDRFKQVNDTHGHAVGDALLRQIAERLQNALRRSETRTRRRGGRNTVLPARISGDEFVVLLEGIEGIAAAQAVGERLLASLADPYNLEPALRVHSSASIGVVASEHCTPDTDAHGLLRDADTAMYEAKRAGRARLVIFDPAMHHALARRAELEAELRLAIADGQIVPAYQPIVDLASGRAVGVEALARWQHPTRGAISPAEFIPVAEDSGLITALGAAMLEAACRDFVGWQHTLGEDAPRSLAVNLSRAQAMDDRLTADVQRILETTAIDPRQLQLEVTESMAGEESSVRDALQRLKGLGLTIALDDFGTGYSSLACLDQLPVDVVKIDRSFVRDAQDNEVHRVLIQATVQVARALGMSTVAEGIEQESQVQLVRALGCEKAQGFLFSKPLPSLELQAWLRARALRPAA